MAHIDGRTAGILPANLSDYEKTIMLLCAKKEVGMSLYFRSDQWSKIKERARMCGVHCGDMLRLELLGRLPAGEATAILCGRGHLRDVFLTAPVSAALERKQAELGINAGALIRAAFLFYRLRLGDKPPLVNRGLYLVDGATLGWRRTSFRCGERILRQVEREKQETGAPTSAVIAHTLYSFLQEDV
jgi:hypothetical protein